MVRHCAHFFGSTLCGKHVTTGIVTDRGGPFGPVDWSQFFQYSQSLLWFFFFFPEFTWNEHHDPFAHVEGADTLYPQSLPQNPAPSETTGHCISPSSLAHPVSSNSSSYVHVSRLEVCQSWRKWLLTILSQVSFGFLMKLSLNSQFSLVNFLL